MTDRLDALREAALRLDQAHDAMFHSPSPKAKAELAEAERDYAKALDALHRVHETT
jgi:hypothetical protein